MTDTTFDAQPAPVGTLLGTDGVPLTQDPGGTPVDRFAPLTALLAVFDAAGAANSYGSLSATILAGKEFAPGESAPTTVAPSAGSVTWATVNHHRTALLAGNGVGDFGAQLVPLASAWADGQDFQMDAKLGGETATHVIGLILTDGTTAAANACGLIFYQAGGTLIVSLRTGTLAAFTSAVANISGVIGPDRRFRLKRSGTTLKCYMGRVGEWQDLGAIDAGFNLATGSMGVTPTHFGIAASNYGSGPASVACDFVRQVA